MKFLIVTPVFNINSGGTICLHKLCNILNIIGYQAYLTPFVNNYEITHKRPFKDIFRFLKISNFFNFSHKKNFSKNNFFNNPIIFDPTNIKDLDSWVVIYPEIVFGNPLGFSNVVRWFLHNPGYHSGKFFYGPGEIYFKFNSAIKDFDYPGSLTSKTYLPIIHYPLDIYHNNSSSSERSGTAYCIRKGHNLSLVHDLENSICIDNLNHHEIAEIFRSVKTFISYDPYTAYSRLAVLCGCESVVVPINGLSEDEWYPDPICRLGISYGFDNLTYSHTSRNDLINQIKLEHSSCLETVRLFADEVTSFFNISN